jgi:predicted nucleic acid-binding protein
VSLIVLDASVAVKWFLPEKVETLATEALALLDRSGKNEIQIIVPDLFWVEFASVLWKAIRRGNFPKDSADAALASLKRFDFPTVPSLKLLDNAFQTAAAHGRTVWECLCVAVALQTNSQLCPADNRLVNSLPFPSQAAWRGVESCARAAREQDHRGNRPTMWSATPAIKQGRIR